MLWPRLLPLAALPDQDIDIPCDVFDKDQDDDDGEEGDYNGEFKFLREKSSNLNSHFALVLQVSQRRFFT